MEKILQIRLTAQIFTPEKTRKRWKKLFYTDKKARQH